VSEASGFYTTTSSAFGGGKNGSGAIEKKMFNEKDFIFWDDKSDAS
jgi:hypothetical protein